MLVLEQAEPGPEQAPELEPELDQPEVEVEQAPKSRPGAGAAAVESEPRAVEQPSCLSLSAAASCGHSGHK